MRKLEDLKRQMSTIVDGAYNKGKSHGIDLAKDKFASLKYLLQMKDFTVDKGIEYIDESLEKLESWR